MRSKLAGVLALLPLVAACSGAAETGSSWTYGPTASPAAATAAASAESAEPTTAGSADEATQVTIGTDTGAALVFDPETASVAGGGTVEIIFENRSTVPHNLTFQDPIDAGTATIVEAGASETIEFGAPAAGDYPFVCTLHPGMEGILTVEDA